MPWSWIDSTEEVPCFAFQLLYFISKKWNKSKEGVSGNVESGDWFNEKWTCARALELRLLCYGLRSAR